MYHCGKRGRGIHVRGGRVKNVLLRADSTYGRMVKKCVQELYSEKEQESHKFYIADSRGVEIWNSDQIEVDVECSGEKHKCCDWSLEKYIKLSGIKYPSKARFFCVEQLVEGKNYYYDLYLRNIFCYRS